MNRRFCTALVGLTGLLLLAPAALAQPDCVAECTDVPGADVMSLEAVYPCVQPGQQVVVELWQHNLDQLVRGYQATMAFDPAVLQVVSVVPTNDPYAKHILRRWDNVLGTIDLARGIDDNFQQPTMVDALLATITFDSFIEDCHIDPEIFGTLVCFRPHLPPTRFSDVNGLEVPPCLKFARVKIDGTDPVVTCPANASYQCADDVPGANTSLVIVQDNCDPDPQVEWLGDQSNGGDGCPGDPLIITRKYRVTDCSLNQTECTQVFTVVDDTAPEITCPPDASYQCPDEVPAPNPALVTAIDNCDPSPTVVWVSDTNNGGAGCPGSPLIITRTYRATDSCNNRADCRQVITVVDDTKPAITCPDDLEYQCADEVPAPNPALVSATDNCDPNPAVIWVRDTNNGGAGCPGDPLIITRVYRATDSCNNFAECQQTITVVDNMAPVVVCPPGAAYQCADEVPPPDPGLVTATDNCDPNPTVVWVGDTNNGGAGCPDQPLIITRTYRATDSCDNSRVCQQVFAVMDDTKPSITCPADAFYDCPAQVPAPDPTLATATDNCDPNPAVIWVKDTNNGGAGCPGDPLVIWRVYRAVDFCGNTDECTQTFTVVDDSGTPPVITCPDDGEYECFADVPAPAANVVEFLALPGADVTDNCTPQLDIVITHLGDTNNGGAGCPGDPLIITRKYRASDTCNNSSDCEQTFTVIDTTNPVITCPADAPYQCVSEVPAPNVDLVTATDNCDPDPTVTWMGDTNNGGAGCPGDPYIVTRTYRAADFCGNYAECRQVFTVIDDTEPEITCPSDARYQCSDDVPAPNPAQVTATDNCDLNPTVIWVSDSPNGGSGCPGDPLVITRTYRATDDCGNDAECEQIITVLDDTAPQVTCPANAAYQCEDEVPAPNPGQVTAVDNCDPSPTVIWVRDTNNGGSGCPGSPLVITRTYRATDRCDNSAECQQMFTVTDDQPPVITGCPANASYQCEDEVPAADPGLVTAIDNCDPDPTVTWMGDTNNGGAGCPGDPLVITRTYRAADFCGNYDECQQVFTVIDDTEPEFIDGCGPSLIKVFPNVGDCDAVVNFDPWPVATDNCDDDVDIEPFRDDGKLITEPFPIGDTTVYWVATDDCGNVAVCWQVVQVEGDNLIEVYVELQGILRSPLQRCIDFAIWRCGVPAPVQNLDEMLLFITNGVDRSWGTAQLRVPACDGDPLLYSCMTAMDKLHTLRSSYDLDIIWYLDFDNTLRSKYLAEYKDPRTADPADTGHWLLGGNFDPCLNPTEEFVDILDFGVYSSQYLTAYPSGNTPCPACDLYPHADANGDRRVDDFDFAFIFINFWKRNEPNCCGAPGASLPRPVMDISLDELRQRGWEDLAAGDLNRDGRLNLADVSAYLNGARPKRPFRNATEVTLPPTGSASSPNAVGR